MTGRPRNPASVDFLAIRAGNAIVLLPRFNVTFPKSPARFWIESTFTLEVPAVKFKELAASESAEPSAKIRERVISARKIQTERFSKEKKVFANAHMQTRHLKKYCQITSAGQELLRAAMSRLGLSARAYDRILKVARTIADLEASPDIKESHLSEAIQYRTLDRNLWM